MSNIQSTSEFAARMRAWSFSSGDHRPTISLGEKLFENQSVLERKKFYQQKWEKVRSTRITNHQTVSAPDLPQSCGIYELGPAQRFYIRRWACPVCPECPKCAIGEKLSIPFETPVPREEIPDWIRTALFVRDSLRLSRCPRITIPRGLPRSERTSEDQSPGSSAQPISPYNLVTISEHSVRSSMSGFAPVDVPVTALRKGDSVVGLQRRESQRWSRPSVMLQRLRSSVGRFSMSKAKNALKDVVKGRKSSDHDKEALEESFKQHKECRFPTSHTHAWISTPMQHGRPTVLIDPSHTVPVAERFHQTSNAERPTALRAVTAEPLNPTAGMQAATGLSANAATSTTCAHCCSHPRRIRRRRSMP